MKKLAGIFAILVLFKSAYCLSHIQVAEIDDLIQNDFLPSNHIPGMGLAIVHGDEVLARGYGFRDLEQQLFATSETLFAIGSVSKSFTAVIAIRVLSNAFPELGESVLDVPIRTLVPSYNFTLIDRFRSENMNFRDLLSHRVCTLPVGLGLSVFPYKEKAEYIYRQRYAESVCTTRTNLIYNNGLIQVAGEIAAAVANRTFEELLTELFADIGMRSSRFIQDSDDLENGIPLFSKPYYREDGETKRFNTDLLKLVTFAPGSGGILTTASDFAKYLQFHLSHGKVGTVQLIPEEVMKWTQTLSNLATYSIPSKNRPDDLVFGDVGYGLGVFIGLYEGYTKVSHGGYLPPYESMMTMVPALNIGILTTLNGPGNLISANITQDMVHARILNILQGSNKKVGGLISLIESERPNTQPVERQQRQNYNYDHTKVKAKEDDVAGIYGNPLEGEFSVSRVNTTTLYLTYGKFGRAWLAQIGTSGIFPIIWDSDITQLFLTDSPIIPPAFLDYREPPIAVLDIGGGRTKFLKDLTLDKLPVQPWDPNSC